MLMRWGCSIYMTQEASFDPIEFEQEWVALNEGVIRDLLANPEIEAIKQKVRNQGHVAIEDRDQFIELVNQVKYQHIYDTYGTEGTAGYTQFVEAWQNWQKVKGPMRAKPENMFEDNINHLLYGSTPDPDMFLKDFDVNRDV